jgi:hypothetical protein
MSKPELIEPAPAIPCFRELYDNIVEYRRHSLACDVLNRWIEMALEAINELKRFSVCSVYDHRDEAAQNAMWNLYALNRVNDLLLMSFQGGVDENKIAPVSLDEYEAWFSALGFAVVASEMLSPFHHEIVQVHQSSEDGEAVAISRYLWPGLMFGDMLFSRSGVEVTGGRKNVAKDIAEQSTLYFTYLSPGASEPATYGRFRTSHPLRVVSAFNLTILDGSRFGSSVVFFGKLCSLFQPGGAVSQSSVSCTA